MAYSLFFVPSVTPQDEAAVWQLQLLAQAHGFSVNAARRTSHATISNAVKAQMRDSDAIVLIATKPLQDHALAEVRWAMELPRPVLALVEETFALRVTPKLKALTFRRGQDISDVGARLMKYVREVTSRQRARKEAQTALAWLLGIGLALFALSSLAGERK